MNNREQPGLFDFEQRMREISSKDPPARLNEVVDWQMFRAPIEKARSIEAKGPGGRPSFDAIVMFKALVLGRLYHLSDGQTEFMIRDRLSFMKFVGVDLSQRIPDEKTIWRFREQLIKAAVIDSLWEIFDRQLERLGVETTSGKIIDASIVVSSNTSRTNQDTRSSDKQDDAQQNNPHRKRQLDTDARVTRKAGRWLYGYKNHIKIDADTKLITSDAVTHAAVHDRIMLPHLLSQNDMNCELYADKGYAGSGPHQEVRAVGAIPRIMHKAVRNTPLNTQQKADNKRWAKTRCRVEHVFGDQQTSMRLTKIRTRGKPRAEFTIRLNNLVYNLKRLAWLIHIQQPQLTTA